MLTSRPSPASIYSVETSSLQNARKKDEHCSSEIELPTYSRRRALTVSSYCHLSWSNSLPYNFFKKNWSQTDTFYHIQDDDHNHLLVVNYRPNQIDYRDYKSDWKRRLEPPFCAAIKQDSLNACEGKKSWENHVPALSELSSSSTASIASDKVLSHDKLRKVGTSALMAGRFFCQRNGDHVKRTLACQPSPWCSSLLLSLVSCKRVTRIKSK